MKKITYPIISIIFLIFINACAGYKPIYTTNLQFKIANYSIKSNKQLGKEIYYKLYNFFKPDQDNPEAQSITITIDTIKSKDATAKDSTGKILEFRIILNSNIIIKDYLTDDEILNHNFSYSSIYAVQDLYSETIKLENKSTKDLINKTYQDLLIKISQTIQTQ
jgi:hypothetical protein|tara:strand:+ start:385 stop:876 length:492 start_codon:yes stop_codon:yes gene_type:complete